MFKKYLYGLIIIAIISTLTACANNQQAKSVGKNIAVESAKATEEPPVPSTETSKNNNLETSTAPTPTTAPNLSENTSHGSVPFAPIIEAYAALERSDYTSFDKDIIGESVLVVTGGRLYNFGDKPTLMYAFYDINGDGSTELLIGAEECISGIYTLQNGTPASVIQVESRHGLNLLMDNDDKCVIVDSWGHMGYATEFFYTIDENGKLVTLDKLHTNGDIIKDDKLIGHLRTKEVLGKEVSITEEEYCSLMQKYGSTGYEPFEDTGKERMVDVVWKPVAT